MRLKVNLITITALVLLFSGPAFAEQQGWQEYKSSHFVAQYHPQIPAEYVREFARKCEKYYQDITDRLGFRRFDYWSWEKRAHIFIYASREQYVKERARPSWSAASTLPAKKTIATYYFAKDFFDTILPHELTHIVLRECIGPGTEIPLWFEEGVACANEDEHYQRYVTKAQEFLRQGVYLSLADLSSPGSAQSLNAIAKSDREFPTLFYSTSASVVIFLQERYGASRFIELCRSLRDGNSFYTAINKVYRIQGPGQLNSQFLSFLQ